MDDFGDIFGPVKTDPKPTSEPAKEAEEERVAEETRSMPAGFSEFMKGAVEFHKYMTENYRTENFDSGMARRKAGVVIGHLDFLTRNWF